MTFVRDWQLKIWKTDTSEMERCSTAKEIKT